MVTIVSGKASLSPSRYGKRRMAASMFTKGKDFVRAAILLQRHGGFEYVVLHLLCQGIEASLKGLLLLSDYDRHISRLKRPLHHNLVLVTSETLAAYGLKPMRADIKKELTELGKLYSENLLRYGSAHDLLVDPQTIAKEKVLRRFAAAIRFADRELAKSEGAP
jgi:hypothetical protein